MITVSIVILCYFTLLMFSTFVSFYYVLRGNKGILPILIFIPVLIATVLTFMEMQKQSSTMNSPLDVEEVKKVINEKQVSASCIAKQLIETIDDDQINGITRGDIDAASEHCEKINSKDVKAYLLEVLEQEE